MAQIILSSSAAHDAGTEKIHLAGGVTVFGRDDDCDVVLRDVHCSRRHIEIRSIGDRYVLRDLDSTNGVLLNGQRVVADCQLREGDVIELGMTRLCFQPDRLEKELPATAVLPVVDSDDIPTEVFPRPRTMPRPARSQNTLAFVVMAALVAVIAGLGMQPTVRQRLFPLATAAGKTSAEPRSKAGAVDRPAADEVPHDPAAISHVAPAPSRIAAAPSRLPTRAPDGRAANTPVTRPQPMPPGPATLENLLEQVPAEPPTAAPTAVASRGNVQEAASRPPAPPKTSAAAGASSPPSDASAPSRPAAPPRADRPEAGVQPRAAAVTAERLAVPPDDEVEREMRAIKKTFGDNFSARADLARLLAKIRSADRHSDNAAKTFALLVTAEREAIQAELYRDAIDCLRLRSDIFDLDELPARIDLLREASEESVGPSSEVFDLAMATAFEAVRAERFDVALKAAHVAEKLAESIEQSARQQVVVRQSAAEPARDGRPVDFSGPASAMPSGAGALADAGRWVAMAQQLRKRILEAKRLRAKYVDACEELRESPHDKSASEIVGKYLCFVKEDWRAGIPALATGRSTALGELAARELALGRERGADPQAAFALAGEWWTLAERGIRASGLPAGSSEILRSHAAEIYERILDQLTDPVDAAVAENRVAAAKATSGSDEEEGEFDAP
jgi:hypothetical protein